MTLNNKKPKTMREIKISLDTATRWANGTDEELKALALQTYPELAKKELPKSWEELGKVNGWCVDNDSKTHEILTILSMPFNKNVFKTKEQAEASISTAMYSQLLVAYKEVSIKEFIEIAKEYEPKVIPILELFFKEYAESAFYYGLLSQLRDEYRNGWTPDWNDDNYKYSIEFWGTEYKPEFYAHRCAFLSFQDTETRDLFLENFRELIEKAKPLMS